MNVPLFGLNRFDSRSVDLFAADVRRAEILGWDAALQPDSQLRRRDTYVLLAAAAKATERITLGPLLANPVNRHPSVTASSIATIDELAPGRTIIGCGVGDTAVRLAGLRPARVKELEAGTRLMRALLDGDSVEVGAERPASLPHHRPVPIWIAAGGPRTLRMAGGVADGVFIRTSHDLRVYDEATGAQVPVSFDVNYRSRLWEAGEAREFFQEIFPRLRYLFVGSDDAEIVFKLVGPPEDVLRGLRAVAPKATIALTLGEAGSAVLTNTDGIVRPSRLYTVSVVDRVGAGDAYAAGFLWAMLTGRAAQDAVDAATALAALKCTVWGDIPLVTRAELEELLASDSTEIRR